MPFLMAQKIGNIVGLLQRHRHLNVEILATTFVKLKIRFVRPELKRVGVNLGHLGLVILPYVKDLKPSILFAYHAQMIRSDLRSIAFAMTKRPSNKFSVN